MTLFKTLAVIFVFVTICSTTNSQITDIKTTMNVTKNTENKFAIESEENINKNGRDNSAAPKPGYESKSINPNLLPSSQQKLQISIPKPKSMQLPLNFKIDTRPLSILAKTPLVKSGPAHHTRLKADQDKTLRTGLKIDAKLGLNNNVPKMKIMVSDKVAPLGNKGSPKDKVAGSKNKVMPKDKVTSKPTLAFSSDNRKQPAQNSKIKRVDFFEDDTNIKSLPAAPKEAVTKKNMMPENVEEDIDHNSDVVNIKNATHLIRISKIQHHHDADNHESGHRNPHEVNHDKTLVKDKNQGNTQANTLDNIKAAVPEKEEVTLAMFINRDGVSLHDEQSGNSKTEVLKSAVSPSVENNIKYDSPDVITITNRNYQEVENRGVCLEVNSFIKDDATFTTPSWNTIPTNPYNNYFQNHQKTYDQYLNYIADSNTTLFEELDNFNTVPPSSEGQILQDVYYGFKPESQRNIIDIRPENNLGTIWRAWKDTEIKISRPNLYNNKPDFGSIFNDYNNYGEMTAKTNPRTLFATPAVGPTGYNNLNNPVPYPYSYQPYRYM